MQILRLTFSVFFTFFFIQDFEEFPEHRTNFFYLLQAVNSHCFPAFLSIPPAQFKLVLDSIIWAFKHTMRNVADTGTQVRSSVTSSCEWRKTLSVDDDDINNES